jgi:hypothetical protein
MSEGSYHRFEEDTFNFWDTLIIPIDDFEIQVYSIKDILKLINRLSALSREQCIQPSFFKGVTNTHNFRIIHGTYLAQSTASRMGVINIKDKIIESWANTVTRVSGKAHDFSRGSTSDRLIFFIPDRVLVHFAVKLYDLPEIVGEYIQWRINVRKRVYV